MIREQAHKPDEEPTFVRTRPMIALMWNYWETLLDFQQLMILACGYRSVP